MVHLREVDADRQAKEAVDAAHPVGVALRQVVVDRDEVHASSRQRIQVDGQRRNQCLALAGAHFGNLAVMQRHAADELHVEVPHLQCALARFADNGERFRQDRIELFSVGDALAERTGLAPQFVVGQGGERRLERIDLADHLTVLLEQPLVAAAEDLGQDIGVQDIGNHLRLADAAGPKKQGVRIPSPLPCANAPVWIS